MATCTQIRRSIFALAAIAAKLMFMSGCDAQIYAGAMVRETDVNSEFSNSLGMPEEIYAEATKP